MDFERGETRNDLCTRSMHAAFVVTITLFCPRTLLAGVFCTILNLQDGKCQRQSDLLFCQRGLMLYRMVREILLGDHSVSLQAKANNFEKVLILLRVVSEKKYYTMMNFSSCVFSSTVEMRFYFDFFRIWIWWVLPKTTCTKQQSTRNTIH
jgi:hypothetical protein